MAVTKIWKINGWIGDCLLYIENPNKTQNPLVIGDPKLKEEEYQSLIDVIEYAEDGNKTRYHTALSRRGNDDCKEHAVQRHA